MNERKVTKVYKVRISATKQEVQFRVPHDEKPPPKIRFFNGNSSFALFSFNEESDGYIELSDSDLERFDRACKNGSCRHFDGASRETGDERFDKRLAKLQKRLKEKNNGDHCVYCEEFGTVMNIMLDPSEFPGREEQENLKTDDLKVSEPQVKSLGASSVQISWNESVANNKHLENCVFELQMAKSKNAGFQNVYSGSEHSVRKDNLLPGTKYYFRLRASKGSVTGPFCSDVFVFTDSTAPSTPDIPHISSKTKTSLGLKWAVKSDNGSPITSCVLQWDKGDSNGLFETIYDGPQKQFKFSHKFPPVTTCRFRVKAINEVGESEFSPELHYTSSAGVPSTPDPPSLVKATASSLHLSWTKPNTNGAEITEYNLQMDDERKGYGFLPVYRGLEQSCTVEKNLQRNTSYKFRLSAINGQGESKWSDIVSFSTRCQAPGRMLPPIVEGKVHTKSFMVSWVAPSDNGGCEIVNYSLEVTNGKGGSFQEVYCGLDTSYKFQDLLPGHTYKLRVSCSSSELKSAWSEVTDVKTLPVVPNEPSAPRLARNAKAQAYSIEIEWDPPSYDGGAKITNYNAQIKGRQDGDFRHIYFGPKTYCCAHDLEPNSEYSFRVRSQNCAGDSKLSKVSCLSTGPGPPDAVQILEVVCRSSSAIHILWKAPKENGSPVTAYTLESAKGRDGSFEKLYCGSANKYDMKKNILPSTVYFFRVQACSCAGCSKWSDVVSCQTPAGPPGQVTQIKLIDRTSTSVTIEWVKPFENGATITSYNIDVNAGALQLSKPSAEDKGDQSDEEDITSDCNTLRYVIQDLQPDSQYKLRVQGVNKSGCGTFSSVLLATTIALRPEAPSLEMVNNSFQSIKLRWSLPRGQSKSGELTYDLQMSSNDSSFDSVFKGSTTSHKVSKLREQTPYSFRVRAANEAGFGPFSEVFMCRTSIQPPAAVKGLHYSNLRENEVTISWKNVPSIEKNDCIKYVLLGKEKDEREFAELYEGTETCFTYRHVVPGKTYSFQVSAERTLANEMKVVGPFSSFISLAVPSKIVASKPTEDETPTESDLQPKQLSEKQLAGIFFLAFAFIVIVISVVVAFVIT